MKKYNYLNLNQKMIKIRKKVPELIKKRYSEEVDYDFVKIDDIYELLTPALNKYGVDFEIVGESSSQRDADGNLAFLKEDNGLWRYEADLEICWINADCPDDRKYAHIHVIGTHEVPEKAKGTAWTYGLKYYLLNRFSIKQGGFEDPDMTNHHLRDEQRPEDKTVEKSGSKKGSDTGARAESSGKRPQDVVRTQTGPSDKKESAKAAVRNGNAPSGRSQEQKEATLPGTRHEEKKTEARGQSSTVTEAKGKKEQVAEAPAESAAGGSNVAGNPKKEYGTQEKLELENPQQENAEMDEELFNPELEGEEPEPSEEGTGQFTDGFQSADSEDVPFFEDEAEDKEDDGEFMQNLRQDIEDAEAEEETEEETETDRARNVKCDFGLYSGKTLGEMLDSPKGRESVKWIAQRYRGANTVMKEAAKLLINGQRTEKRAA